jgi:2-C-methyl-D-erythritol 4-phosphate cytidylyltransferase
MKTTVPKPLLSLETLQDEMLGDSIADIAAPEATVLGATISRFYEAGGVRHIVVCYPEEWRSQFERYSERFSGLILVQGGSSRQRSVQCGVKALSDAQGVSSEEIVLVHDAARCNVSTEVIQRVVNGVVQSGAVTAGVPVSDSLCRVAGDGGVVCEYVDRSSVFAVQTPQGFRLADLTAAHDRAERDGIAALDDASLVRAIREVVVVAGDPLNIKITHPSDLDLVRLCRSRVG